jgi:hypothetical protein
MSVSLFGFTKLTIGSDPLLEADIDRSGGLTAP